MTAKEITAGLLCALPKHFPCRAFRRNVGTALAGDRFVRFGVPGEADITGIISIDLTGASGPVGIRLEIEVKAGRDRMRPEQESFRNMIERFGGIYIIARDIDGTLAELSARLASIGGAA